MPARTRSWSWPADDPLLEEEEEDNDDVGHLIDGESGEEEER
jgi:hypothetical protein